MGTSDVGKVSTGLDLEGIAMSKTATVHAQQKWEYMELTRKTESFMINDLNELGQSGWELVAISNHKDSKSGLGGSDCWTAFLKRPHSPNSQAPPVHEKAAPAVFKPSEPAQHERGPAVLQPSEPAANEPASDEPEAVLLQPSELASDEPVPVAKAATETPETAKAAADEIFEFKD